MILDLPRFLQAGKPYWDELQTVLQRIEAEPEGRKLAGRIKAEVTAENLKPKRRQAL